MKALLLGLSLAAVPTAVMGASFNIITIDTGYRVCSNVSAAGPKGAFIACFNAIGLPIPSADAIVTSTRVCKSTHRVQQIGGSASWAYDRRLSHATRPGCPG